MIRWYETESGFQGFSYYPLLEIAVGIFLLVVAIIVPALYLFYNGIKLANWGEILFCIGFFILFIFMGKSLTFQSFAAIRTQTGFSFYQNLREPPVETEIDSYDWKGIETSTLQLGEEEFITLNLKIEKSDEPATSFELYRSVNRKEINSLVQALEQLRKQNEEKTDEPADFGEPGN